MSQLPSKQELVSKIIQLESYIQTLEKANQSKNSQLTLLRKKVQLLKDQNMVLKVQSKNPSYDKYLNIQSIVVELEEKLEVAMQQCLVYKTENQKLKRRLDFKNKSYQEEERLSVNRLSHHSALMPSSPTKLTYPVSILKNKEQKPKASNILENSLRFNTIEKRPSLYNSQKYHSNKCFSKRDGLTEELYDYNKEVNSFEPQAKFSTQNMNMGKVFTMMDGNVSFSNLHNTTKRNRNSMSNSNSKKQKPKIDSNRSYMFTDGECQALGKIIDQLRDGQRKIKGKY